MHGKKNAVKTGKLIKGSDGVRENKKTRPCSKSLAKIRKSRLCVYVYVCM